MKKKIVILITSLVLILVVVSSAFIYTALRQPKADELTSSACDKAVTYVGFTTNKEERTEPNNSPVSVILNRKSTDVSQALTVNFTFSTDPGFVVGGDASFSSSINTGANTVTFTAGETTKTLHTITAINDTMSEGTESVTYTIDTSVGNYIVGSPTSPKLYNALLFSLTDANTPSPTPTATVRPTPTVSPTSTTRPTPTISPSSTSAPTGTSGGFQTSMLSGAGLLKSFSFIEAAHAQTTRQAILCITAKQESGTPIEGVDVKAEVLKSDKSVFKSASGKTDKNGKIDFTNLGLPTEDFNSVVVTLTKSGYETREENYLLNNGEKRKVQSTMKVKVCQRYDQESIDEVNQAIRDESSQRAAEFPQVSFEAAWNKAVSEFERSLKSTNENAMRAGLRKAMKDVRSDVGVNAFEGKEKQIISEALSKAALEHVAKFKLPGNLGFAETLGEADLASGKSEKTFKHNKILSLGGVGYEARLIVSKDVKKLSINGKVFCDRKGTIRGDFSAEYRVRAELHAIIGARITTERDNDPIKVQVLLSKPL